MMGPDLHNGDAGRTVCELHLDLSGIMAGVSSDVKWLLRLGYGGFLVLLAVIAILYPYGASLNRDLTEIKQQVAVNTKQIEVLKESDTRSEGDRHDLRRILDDFRQAKISRGVGN